MPPKKASTRTKKASTTAPKKKYDLVGEYKGAFESFSKIELRDASFNTLQDIFADKDELRYVSILKLAKQNIGKQENIGRSAIMDIGEIVRYDNVDRVFYYVYRRPYENPKKHQDRTVCLHCGTNLLELKRKDMESQSRNKSVRSDSFEALYGETREICKSCYGNLLNRIAVLRGVGLFDRIKDLIATSNSLPAKKRKRGPENIISESPAFRFAKFVLTRVSTELNVDLSPFTTEDFLGEMLNQFKKTTPSSIPSQPSSDTGSIETEESIEAEGIVNQPTDSDIEGATLHTTNSLDNEAFSGSLFSTPGRELSTPGREDFSFEHLMGKVVGHNEPSLSNMLECIQTSPAPVQQTVATTQSHLQSYMSDDSLGLIDNVLDFDDGFDPMSLIDNHREPSPSKNDESITPIPINPTPTVIQTTTEGSSIQQHMISIEPDTHKLPPPQPLQLDSDDVVILEPPRKVLKTAISSRLSKLRAVTASIINKT